MTPAEIKRMAREAGLYQDGEMWYSVGPSKYDEQDVSTEDLARFAALVRAQALEDAARIAETPVSGEQDDITMAAKDRAAAAIRALAGQPSA